MTQGQRPPQHRFTLPEILTIYREGYYPLWYEEEGLVWVREDERAFIPINDETLARARRLKRRIRTRDEITIRHTHNFEGVINALRDPDYRDETWVQDEVVEVYRTLHRAGFLATVEAWRGEELVGGLLGIDWPNAFIAETMFQFESDASKLCLIDLVETCHAQGCKMIDVQQEHPRDHPSSRLGETVLEFEDFMELFEEALSL
jgi:leucyl/phenylalanyl-tRNA--protein transferase